jgi:hypothetical protein
LNAKYATNVCGGRKEEEWGRRGRGRGRREVKEEGSPLASSAIMTCCEGSEREDRGKGESR